MPHPGIVIVVVQRSKFPYSLIGGAAAVNISQPPKKKNEAAAQESIITTPITVRMESSEASSA